MQLPVTLHGMDISNYGVGRQNIKTVGQKPPIKKSDEPKQFIAFFIIYALLCEDLNFKMFSKFPLTP